MMAYKKSRARLIQGTLTMTDHPFDEIAVEAAREAVKAIIDRQANTLEDITDLIVPAALTAACKSMAERGKARDGNGCCIAV